MDTLVVSITDLDDDTKMVAVAGQAPSAACLQIHDALRQAEACGKPGLVVNLSELVAINEHVLRAVRACQERCIEAGRWLLIVPPGGQARQGPAATSRRPTTGRT